MEDIFCNPGYTKLVSVLCCGRTEASSITLISGRKLCRNYRSDISRILTRWISWLSILHVNMEQEDILYDKSEYIETVSHIKTIWTEHG